MFCVRSHITDMIMKQGLIITICSILLVSCGTDVPPQGAVIEGNVSGFDPQDTISAVLFNVDGHYGKGIMTDTLLDGRFSFHLDSIVPGTYYSITFLRLIGEQPQVVCDMSPSIYLEPGALVRISGEGKHLFNARIDSPVKDQKLQQQFVSKMSQDDLNELQDIGSRRQQATWAIHNGLYTSQASLDSLRQITRDGLETIRVIKKKVWAQEVSLLETEPIGKYALKTLHGLAGSVVHGDEQLREPVTRLLNRLSEEQKQSREGKEIINYLKIIKGVYVGDAVPGYEYLDDDGGRHFLSEFAGKWVLLDFWGRGCHGCIDAFKELKELAAGQTADSPVLVSIGVNTEEIWKEGVKQHGITWTSWRDPLGPAGSVLAYNTAGMPVFVLINPAGKIEEIMPGYSYGSLQALLEKCGH